MNNEGIQLIKQILEVLDELTATSKQQIQLLGSKFNEANQTHATAYGALIVLLINKGIITQEEYDRIYIQVQHDLSQEFARKRDEAQHNKKE